VHRYYYRSHEFHDDIYGLEYEGIAGTVIFVTIVSHPRSCQKGPSLVLLAEINAKIPDYKEIEDHKVAKQTMKTYLENMMEEVESKVDLSTMPETAKAIAQAKEILSDENFIIQKGVRSLVDKDTRVGHKSKTDSFYGYKTEFTMIPEERIIMAVKTCDGAYVDGSNFEELYERSKDCGINIKNVYGDKAYFRRPILDILKVDKVEAMIPVSASVYKIDESRFSYNKDSDQWFCAMGNQTIKKKLGKSSWGADIIKFTFDKVMCKECPNRIECAGKKA